MKVLGLLVAVLVLGACGAKVGSGDATTPITGAPATSAAPAPSVDAKLPGLDTPAPAWYFPNPAAVSGLAGADQARRDALAQALGGPVVFADDPTQSWTYTTAPGSPAWVPPSADDAARARAVAERVWQAAGLDLSSADITVGPEGRIVTAVERLGGVPSPLPFAVSVAPDLATVTSASGHFATATEAGPLDRIGTAAALSLLTAAPAGDDRGQQPLAPNTNPPPAVAPLNPQPTTEPAPEVSAVGRMLLPVTGVTEIYAVVPGDDGGTWLLPGYRFTFDDGSSTDVLAVAGPPAADASTGGGSSPPPTTCAAGPDCGISEFVGMAEDQAAATAAARGKAFRVAERDGVEQMLTADYSPDRVNVAITDATVTRAWYG